MSSVGVSPFLKNRNLALAGVVPASQLQRATPLMVPSGVAAFDQLTGGLPRGALSEICGPASSGRTSLLLASLAARTAAGEACVLIDVSDSFDPLSAEASGVDLRRVLWVRCGESSNHRGYGGRGGRTQQNEKQDAIKGAAPSVIGLRSPRAGKKSDERSNVEAAIEAGVLQFDPDHEHNAHYLPYQDVVRRPPPAASKKGDVASSGFRVTGASCPIGNAKHETRNTKLSAIEQGLKAADLVLQAGGFGMVAMDLGDVPVRDTRRIPLTSWFRFRRAVENTATVFVVLEREPFAKQCASLVVGCWASAMGRRAGPTHTRLLGGTEIDVEVLRAPGTKKPAGSARFATMPSWAIRK